MPQQPESTNRRADPFAAQSRRALLLTAAALYLATSAQGQPRVTALAGPVTAGESSLKMHSEVPRGAEIQTQADGKCSMLVAQRLVMQFCNGARLSFAEEGSNDPRVVKLTGGELKASVGKRDAEEPIEIHTPAAVATILGTVVHVAVDPDTGDTTVRSFESRVRVQSSDPNTKGEIVIEAGEAVTIRRGEKPGKVRRFDAEDFANISECVDDGDFRRLALVEDRRVSRALMLEQIAVADTPTALPSVSPQQAIVSPIASEANDLSGPCQSVECFAAPALPAPPTGCGAIPGDHCIRGG